MRLIICAGARELDRQLQAAEKKVTRASEARFRLPAGSSRARVTTANARYMTACEHRDRIERALIQAHDLLNGAATTEVAS